MSPSVTFSMHGKLLKLLVLVIPLSSPLSPPFLSLSLAPFISSASLNAFNLESQV